MTMNVNHSNWYDFGSLAELRGRASGQPGHEVSGVSAQFESLFLNLMLKEMRKSIQKSDLLGSDAMETYEQMFDQQVALGMAKAGGIGIGKFVETQVAKNDVKEASLGNVEGIETATALRQRFPVIRER
jgi:flagellar protein FlgJ